MAAEALDRPADLTIDFDFYRPGVEGLDPFAAFLQLLDAPPVAWCPAAPGRR